ncbi:NADH-quinone oxidoreductase subunit A, partial [Klebsiella pneumoniae]
MNSSVSAVEVLAQESADSGLGVFLPLVLLFGLALAFALFSV